MAELASAQQQVQQQQLHQPQSSKEGNDNCPCSNFTDRRERHVVSRLSRSELEDKYLRLLEEVNSLKKLCNSQEDKLKRLATKLMRVGAGGCPSGLQTTNECDKIALLQAENSKLKDKLQVMRTQLANNKIFQRSPSRGRKPAFGPSTSAPITCRSENSRLKTASCQCISATGRSVNDGAHLQNCSAKNKESKTEGGVERKELEWRISELELELEGWRSSNQREKVAENVEYIRVWRQMKQQNEKLVATENANDVLTEQVCQLKKLLDQACKDGEMVCAQLASEKEQVARLDVDARLARQSASELRDKDERIKDLANETRILQQHNKELLELSCKFGKVELENDELKQKLVEARHQQNCLSDALCKANANTHALQVANSKLIEKIEQLQNNIDKTSIHNLEQNGCPQNNNNNNNVNERDQNPKRIKGSSESCSLPQTDPPDSPCCQQRNSVQQQPEPCNKCRADVVQNNCSLPAPDERPPCVDGATQTDDAPAESAKQKKKLCC